MHFFPGFTIIFLTKHTFTDSTGSMEVLHAHYYQGQFHLHDGQGRLTIDACSVATSDGSRHPRFSADFAYHSLPIILNPVLHAWNSTHAKTDILTFGPSP
jgi:hypothetical protein